MTNRTVLVRLRAQTSDFERGMMGAARSVNTLRKEIDTTNDRTAWLAQGLLALGPATVPIGAAVVPVLAGLTTQLGLAVGAAGTAALAFNGVGDALKALNDFQLEPTAANLEKMNQAMAKIGPEGAEFVRFLDSVGPKFGELQDAAREGMFPGMEEGITSLVGMLPQVENIVRGIAEAMGQLSAEAGAGLAGEGFEDFFDFLETNAKPLLIEMGNTIGNFVEGLAAMTVAFAPLSQSFSTGLLNMSQSFANWSHNLDSSDSFQQFLEYVQQAGPMALDLFGSLVSMFVQLAQAAAPVGDVLVPALASLADLIGALADTPLGPTFIAAAAAMSAYGRAVALASITTSGLGKAIAGTFQAGRIKEGAASLTMLTTAQQRATMSATALADAENKKAAALRGGAVQVGKAGAAIAGMALLTSGAADGIGLTNTASLALMGTLGGPWGVAIGAGIGAVMDLSHANDSLEASIRGANAAIDDADLEKIRAQREELEALLQTQNPSGMNVDFESGGRMLAGLWNDISGSTDDAKNKLEDLADAEAAVRQGMLANGDAYAQYRDGVSEASQAAEEHAVALEDAVAAMRAMREELNRSLNAELNYKASLLDARDALKENGKTVNENTRAGQANLRTLYAMPSAWNQQSAAAKGANGALRQARAAFVETATAMGMAEGKAERLARRLYEIPERRVTKVEAQTQAAENDLRRMKDVYDSLRNKTVTISIERRGDFGGMGRPGEPLADGGVIRGPGGPTDDKIPAWLSNGEFVVKAAAVSSYGLDMLHAINAQRFADGGSAGTYVHRQPTPSVKAGDGWMGQLAAAALNATQGLKGLKAQLAEAQKAVARESAARDALRSQMAELASGVANSLRSDIFATPEQLEGSSNVWVAGASAGGTSAPVDPNSVLSADIARGKEFIRLVKELKAKGLDGPALAELLMSGDIERARLYANMSAADLKTYEKLYEQREQVLAEAGQTSANAAFGAAEAAATAELKTANERLAAIEKAIKNADKNNKDGHKGTQDSTGEWARGARAGHRRAKVRGGA